MKTTIALAAVSIALAAGGAHARDTGIINQAGPYEANMQFYLHPAQGFPGTPETARRVTEETSSASKGEQAAAHRPAKRLASRRHDALIKTSYTGRSEPTDIE